MAAQDIAAPLAQEAGGAGRVLSASNSLDFLASDLLRSDGSPDNNVKHSPPMPPPPSAPPGLLARAETNLDLASSLPGSVEASPPVQVRPLPMQAPPPQPPFAPVSPEQQSPMRAPPKLPPLGGAGGGGSNQIMVHPMPAPSEPVANQSLGWDRPPPVDTENANSDNSNRVSDLLTMLECPVCLDTADKPPIYQCPEGHLLCDSCNSRLVDCPQCGHALMNARNRTAEELAENLQKMRGGQAAPPAGFLPSHSISIAVSEPQKVRKYFFAKVVYQISTQIGGNPDTGSGEGPSSNYSVTRDYSEIVALFGRLHDDYCDEGVIVPPPPEKSSLAAVAVKVTPNADLNQSMAGKLISKRCIALDRYLKRLARHPVIRKDPIFRSFIQEKETPKVLKQGKPLSKKWTELTGALMKMSDKLTVSEHDPWFQTKSSQLSTMGKQLRGFRSNLKDMAKLKRKLHESTNEFRASLVTSMLAGSAGRARRQSTVEPAPSPGVSSKKEHLAGIISEVVDCHKTMSIINEDQANADDLMVQLANDYDSLISSAQSALGVRRKKQKELQAVTKKSKKKKAEDLMEEIDKCQNDFDKLSQAVRRELEHFDHVMKDEFEEGFRAYRTKYYQSMKVRERVGPEEFNSEP